MDKGKGLVGGGGREVKGNSRMMETAGGREGHCLHFVVAAALKITFPRETVDLSLCALKIPDKERGEPQKNGKKLPTCRAGTSAEVRSWGAFGEREQKKNDEKDLKLEWEKKKTPFMGHDVEGGGYF